MGNEIKIEIKLLNQINLKANANVKFLTSSYGWITIKDYKIWKSSRNNERLGVFINIQPPTIRKTTGGYIERVFIEDEKKWAEVEKLIFDEYQNKLNESAPIDYDAIDQSDSNSI